MLPGVYRNDGILHNTQSLSLILALLCRDDYLIQLLILPSPILLWLRHGHFLFLLLSHAFEPGQEQLPVDTCLLHQYALFRICGVRIFAVVPEEKGIEDITYPGIDVDAVLSCSI